MKKVFFSLFFMLNLLTTFSQTNGLVLDVNGKPIDNVNVFLADKSILLITNSKGEFYFNQTLVDNTYIHLYKYGYHSKLVKFKQNEDLNIMLEKLHVDLDEVGVSEAFYELGSSKLTNIEKKNIDLLNSSSMVESITELSGVDMVSSGIGIQKVVVRGLSGMRVVTFLNGMKINNQQWANDHGIGFTDLGLGEVELIKGASALKFGGEALGGLLYFKDQPFISNERTNGFFATKFNNSSYLSSSQFGVKWNKKNFYLNLYGQYSISSDYRLPNNDYLFNSRFKQDAIKLSIGHRYKKLQNIFRYQLHTEETGIPGHIHGDPSEVDLIEVTSSSIDLPDDYEATRPTQFINNQLFIYETNYIDNNIKINLHAGHFINHLMEYEKWTAPGFDLTISHTRLMPSIRYQLNDLTLNFGSSFSKLENINGEGEDKLVPDASTLSLGSYLIIDYLKNNLGFNAGLRYDYKKLSSDDEMLTNDYENMFSYTSFSTGAYYSVADHILRATYSGAFRSPHLSELFSNGVHHGTNRYEIGNIDLDIEYANQFDFKYQWSDEHLGLVINPFIQYISNYITINPTDSFISGNRVYNYLQFDNVTLSGLEMNLHFHPHYLHNLHFEQSFSFLKNINKDSEYALALTPANSIKTKVLFDFNIYDFLTRYKLDHFSIYHIYKFDQKNFAEYEEFTQGYNIINIELGLNFSDKFRSTIAVNNLFNTVYSPHISRVRGVAGGVPNPGRFLSLNFKYEF